MEIEYNEDNWREQLMKKIWKIMICMFVASLICVQMPLTSTVSAKRQKVIVINPGHQYRGNSSKEAIGPGSRTKKSKGYNRNKGSF